ncbi:ARPP-1 family domain-containing protein [Methanoregula sp.]|jgi:hypothetical protein|uniref:ARPP-1 family domain-containing protein n=1 Tax=Methanoregula sp. TaxID=2052170 RepID=UPI0025DE08B0|nr:DUF6569 family protein [Methanoregula sp.]
MIAEYLAGISLGTAVSKGSMTVFPVFGRSATQESEYLLIQEALDNGVLQITELSEGGRVPELLAVNTGKQSVLLIDGDQVVGGLQDRVVNCSILLAPESRTKLPVSCTERARWRSTSHEFRSADFIMSSDSRRKKMHSVSDSLRRSGSFAGNQAEIWNAVSDLNMKSGAQSPTDAMKDGFAAKKLDIDDLIAAFPIRQHQQGILVFHNARVAGLEILSREDVFLKLYDKLMRSFAIDGSFLEPRVIRKSVLSTTAKAFIAGVTKCTAETFPSIGLGNACRFSGKGMIGAGLVHGNEVIHLSFCAAEDPPREHDDERMAGFRNRQSNEMGRRAVG